MPSNSVLRNGPHSTPYTLVASIALRLWIAVAFGFALSVSSSGQALAGGSWNDEGIKWRGYEDGLKEAKSSAMPICLIYYTEWCPHCSTYSHVFSDPKVVEKSKSFVMIRLDRDKNRELSKQHAPDGEYIPRTYFLSNEGKLDPELRAPRDQYRYFYDENSPDSILAGMDAALKKLTSPPVKSPPAKEPPAKKPTKAAAP